MDEIIKGLKEIKDAIIAKGIADLKYVDLVNDLIKAAEKKEQMAAGINQGDFVGIESVREMKCLPEMVGGITINANYVEINFGQKENENGSPLGDEK